MDMLRNGLDRPINVQFRKQNTGQNGIHFGRKKTKYLFEYCNKEFSLVLRTFFVLFLSCSHCYEGARKSLQGRGKSTFPSSLMTFPPTLKTFPGTFIAVRTAQNSTQKVCRTRENSHSSFFKGTNDAISPFTIQFRVQTLGHFIIMLYKSTQQDQCI